MNDVNSPRLAVVSSNSLGSNTSNGIMMRSLFATWHKGRLAQVCFPLVSECQPRFDVCREYHVIRVSGRVARHTADDTLDVAHSENAVRRWQTSQRMLLRLKANRVLARWLKLAQELWYSNRWIEHQLERELCQIRPDIVYALLGNYFLTRITVRACERLRIPYFLHVTDDFVTAAYDDLPLAPRLKDASQHWFQRAVDGASLRAAISPVMAAAYRQRYGNNWEWFATLVDADDYDPSSCAKDRSHVRLVYTGNLALQRWQVLRDLATTLEQVRQRTKLTVDLHVYAPEDQLRCWGHNLGNSPLVTLKGWVKMEQLPHVLRDADILVHVESDDARCTPYTRYSMSTKLSQYMMAGRCILGFGPYHVGSMRIIQDANAGIVIPNRSGPADLTMLSRLLTDRSQRERFGQDGRHWAVTNVSTTVKRQQFTDLLCTSARRSGQRCVA